MLLVDQQTYDIKIDAGDQERLTLTFTNADGTPWNGTGAALEFVVKESLDDLIASPAIKITTAANPTQWDVTNIATGIAILEFLPANTSSLAGQFHYGVKATGADAKPHTPRRAAFTVRKNPVI
jgi:hypothetical protein